MGVRSKVPHIRFLITYTPVGGNSALGIGWTLTLGSITTLCSNGPCYEAPDGSEHHFAVQANGYLKTTDATQFYLHARTDGTGYDMWDGDGNHYDFRWQVSGFDDPFNSYIHDFGRGRDGFYLKTLTDPYGNQMAVQYLTGVAPCWSYQGAACTTTRMSCPTASTNLWIPIEIDLPSGTIAIGTDSGQKINTLVFKSLPVGTNGAATDVTYTFKYQETETYSNQCNDTTFSRITLEELNEIDLASTSGTGSLGSYTFTYLNGLLASVTLPTHGTISYTFGLWASYHGKLAQLGSNCFPAAPPAGLQVIKSPNWPFGPIRSGPELAGPIPTNCDPNNPDPAQFATNQQGVVQRVESGPGLVTATTTYTHYAYPYGENASSRPSSPNSQDLTVVVFPSNTDGVKHAKAVLFQAGPHNGGTSPLPGDRTGADLQERIFDHDPNISGTIVMPVCGTASVCPSNAVRVVDRTFDYDDPAVQISNRRLLTDTTCYGSETGSTCSTSTKHGVAFSLDTSCGGACTWEGNGRHYNVETHTDGVGSTIRTISTDWTPNNWTANPFSGIPLPNLMSERKKFDSTLTVDQYFDYTAPPSTSVNGFLHGTATFDATPGRKYAVYGCRYPDGNGNLDKEFLASTPISSIPAGFCVMAYPQMPTNVLGINQDAFGRDYAYQFNLRTNSNWIYSTGTTNLSIGWNSFHVARDPVTGWVTSASDTANVATAYTYDALGRVTSIVPFGKAGAYVCYDSTTQTTAYRRASALTCPVASSASGLLTWEQYLYDGLGRLVREIKETGTGTLAFRTHKFDGGKNPYFDSEWGTCTSDTGDCLTNPDPGGTSKSGFDPFGRPQKIIGSSNATYTAIDRTDGAISYSDTLETVTSCVDGTWNGSSCVDIPALSPVTHLSPKTATRRDLFGRTTSVVEDSGGLNYATTYIYDVNDKLTRVTQGSQTRTFTYDPFGFLRTEVTPEKGTVSMVYATSYSAYGSLGNVRQKTEGGSLTSSIFYDPAGRVACEFTGVPSGTQPTCDTPGTGTTIYLRNYYDGAGFPGGNSPLGKVTRRVGSNPLFAPLSPAGAATERIQEDFTYSGIGGRLSDTTTTMFGYSGATPLMAGGVSGATESWSYNSLGLLATHFHPRVTKNLNDRLKETLSYSFGRLTGIGLTGKDFDGTAIPSASITPTFRASGNLGSYTSTLGYPGAPSLVTVLYQDLSGIPRPRQIQAGLSVSPPYLFDTGNIAYDAAGNIATMSSSDLFAYDALSRITSASYAGTSQSYTYDRYGNLLTRSGVVFCTTTCTNNQLQYGLYGDGRGNLTQFGSEVMTYDDRNRQVKDASQATWQYLFSGSDERLARVPSSAPASVPRRELARYIVQGKPYTPGTTCTPGTPFADVSCNDPDWAYIAAIATANLTSGCGGNPPNFCPDSSTTRAQAAVFFMRAEHGSGYNPACVDTYVDAPCTDPTTTFVNQAIAEAVLAVCSPGHACPGSNLTEFDAVKGMADGNLWPNYKPIAGGSLYTLRGSDDHVVTEFADSLPQRDNVYVGNILAASYLPKPPGGAAGSWQFHASDHLGTIRLTVDAATIGSQFLQAPKYWPYGDRVTPPATPLQRVAFAGMERDFENNHFYDHARHHDFNVARFVSPDTLGGHADDPQSWNRYAYAGNNPMRYVDPDGLEKAWAEAVAGAVMSLGSSIQGVGAALNNGSARGVAADFALGTTGSVVQGFGDMLNLGNSTGEVLGAGGDSFDMGNALAADLGRASGIVLTVASIAQAANVPSTTIGTTTISTTAGDVTVPSGYVRSVADNSQGVAYRPPGSTDNAGAMRAAPPNTANPSGYARVYNESGQPVTAAGKPGPRAQTHLPLTGKNTVKPVKVPPAPKPCKLAKTC